MSHVFFRPSTLGANRYGFENRQLDLIPDTYRADNQSKVIVGSLRDNWLDNFGVSTFEYDPEATTDMFKDLANDGAYRDPTFSWRDYDNGSGTIRARQVGVGVDGAPIMQYGSGPNPAKSGYYAGLFNHGTFYKDYKTDQTMAGWDTSAMTGLSYDIVLDTSDSPDVRREKAYKAHLRANNDMQIQRKKPDVAQAATDDMRANMLDRPYSYNGSLDSAAGQQLMRHTKFGPNGQPYLDKQGIWHDTKQRSVDAMRKLRIGGHDAFVDYERANYAPSAVDSGYRQVGASAEAQRRAEVDHMEREWRDSPKGRTPIAASWQADWLANQEIAYDGKSVDSALAKVSANMTISQPAAAYVKYDYKKLQDTQMTRRMLIQWQRETLERDLTLTDAQHNAERLIHYQQKLDIATSGPGATLSDTSPYDTRQVAGLLVGGASTPAETAAYASTGSDTAALYERLAKQMPGVDIPDFVTMSGRVLNTIANSDTRQVAARRAADLLEPGGGGPGDALASTAKFETRMTVNAPAQVARETGRQIADRRAVGASMAGLDSRVGRAPLAADARSFDSMQWNSVGAELNNNPTGEVQARAARYGATPAGLSMAKNTSSDLAAQRDGAIGGVLRR